jgi:hypothetical protein
LDGGSPFCDLLPGDRQTIETITTIRNAIAHSSPHAMKEFRTKVISSLSLLPGERSPAGFLRSQARAVPAQDRLELFVAELGRIAKGLC